MRHHRALRVIWALACLLLIAALVSCGAENGETDKGNTVSEVSLNGDRMTVKATLSEDFLESFEGDEICLLELTSDMDASDDLRELIPLATCAPKARPTFTFDLSDGARTRLYSTFALASYDEEADEYVLLTEPAGVSESELTQGASASDECERSPKGIANADPAEAIRLGVSHTVIRVQMDELLLDGWQEGAVPYIWNGTTRYLRGDALEALDTEVAAYAEARVHVYLQFVLAHDGAATESENEDNSDSDSDSDSKDKPTEMTVGVPREIYPAGVARGVSLCPVNMADRASADIMEGFFDFMAFRYTDEVSAEMYGGADVSFIIGDDANEGGGFADGGMLLSEYVTNYEKLVRLANIAMKSHDPDGRVYISLSSRRSGGGQGTTGKWSIHSFLTAFTAETRARGNYSWHVACDLYADMPTVWLNDPTSDSSRMTARSFDNLTDLLEGAKYFTPDEEMRRIVLTDYRIPSVTEGVEAESRQAASYAYAYRAVAANGQVEALIYGCFEDDDKTACGLRADVDTKDGEENANAGKARDIYDVFVRIDTSASGEADENAARIIKSAYEDLLEETEGAYAVEYIVGSTSADRYDSDAAEDAWMSFRKGDLHGFEGASSLSYLELRRSTDAEYATLHVRFDRAEIADPVGIRTRLAGKDLADQTRLHIDLYAGCVDEDARSSVPVTLRLERPATGKTADGRGRVIYEATVEGIRGGRWQTVTFDIADFEEYLRSSDEVILSLWIDDESGVSYELGIDAIRADSGAGSVLVIVLIVLLALALVAGVTVAVVYFIRRRNGDRADKDKPTRAKRRVKANDGEDEDSHDEDAEDVPVRRAPERQRKASGGRRPVVPDIDDGAPEDYYGGATRRATPPAPDEDGYYDD